MAYLDDTGLAYFWGKIKAYVAALLAPKANDADVVHKTGDELVQGVKEFKNAYDDTIGGDNPDCCHSIVLRTTRFRKGDDLTQLSGNDYITFIFQDNSGSLIDWDGRLGSIGYNATTTDGYNVNLTCHKNDSINRDWAALVVGWDGNGIAFSRGVSTPLPSDRNDGRDILTRNWIPKDTRIVHTTGNEDISGNKHFKNWCVMEDGFRMHEDKSSEFSKGSNPPATSYGTIFMVGDGGYSTGGDSPVNRLLEYNCQINTSGVTKQIFKAFNNTANATDWAELVLINDHGTAWAEAPTPASNANDTKIATTAWVRTFGGNTYLPLTGGTLSGNLNIKNASITRGTAPSSNAERVIYFRDSADNSTGAVSSIYFTDKSSRNAIYAYNTTVASGINIGYIGIGCNSSGNVYTVAPTPATSDNSTQIATTAFVKAQGYITSSSSITGYASGLTARASLGADYEMKDSDFSGSSMAVYGVASFKANTDSVPPTGDTGDYGLFRFYTGSYNYSQFIMSSPRSYRLFYGKFWASDFEGWKEILLANNNITLRGNANTVSLDRDNSALFLCGGTSTSSSCSIVLTGQSDTNKGRVSIVARVGSTSRSLVGTYNGNLTWNGQTIQTTSDARLKTSLDSVPEEVLDAWEDVDWGQFKFLDAVSEKGESARLHLGLVSQQVQKAFSGRGLDACDYGFICHEDRPAYDVDRVMEERPAYTDENGVHHEKEVVTERYHEDAVDLWMIRYTEALCMEAAYQRRENARLRARLASLEDRLAALELRPGSE